MVLAAAALAGGGAHTAPGRTPAIVADRARVFGADAEHERLVRWAFGRYEHAGLDVPPIDVHFHPDTLPGAMGTSDHSSGAGSTSVW